MTPWAYPPDRYYYGWHAEEPAKPTDGEIKSMLVDRLNENPHTKDEDIRVDVEHSVAVLTGDVSSALAKRQQETTLGTPGGLQTSAISFM